MMTVHALADTGGPVGRWLADVDPETGDLILDDSGRPVMVLHYSAREAAPMIGVSHNTVRDRCSSGEWPCRRVGPHGSAFLSTADVAVAIESLRTRPRAEWDDTWTEAHKGIRGVVSDPDEDEEGAR